MGGINMYKPSKMGGLLLLYPQYYSLSLSLIFLSKASHVCNCSPWLIPSTIHLRRARVWPIPTRSKTLKPWLRNTNCQFFLTTWRKQTYRILGGNNDTRIWVVVVQRSCDDVFDCLWVTMLLVRIISFILLFPGFLLILIINCCIFNYQLSVNIINHPPPWSMTNSDSSSYSL